MAEGLLGGMLSDDEKPEVEAPEALASAEAFASAVAAKLAGNDPEVARKTSEFLANQSHLLKIQAEHLVDEPRCVLLICVASSAKQVFGGLDYVYASASSSF